VVGESVEFVGEGVLKVTGVVRGGRLSPDRLVHIPNHGDYRLLKVRVCGYMGLMVYGLLMARSRLYLHPCPARSLVLWTLKLRLCSWLSACPPLRTLW
jgi:hypothetical protein